MAPPPRPQPHESRDMGLATSISPDFYSWLRAYFEFREFRDLQCCMHLLSTCVETSNTQSLPQQSQDKNIWLCSRSVLLLLLLLLQFSQTDARAKSTQQKHTASQCTTLDPLCTLYKFKAGILNDFGGHTDAAGAKDICGSLCR